MEIRSRRTLLPVLLGLILAVGGIGWFVARDRGVVIGVSRGLGTLLPPHRFEADLSRVLGFVLEPICTPDVNSPFFGVRGLASSCEVRNGRVRVLPRKDFEPVALLEGMMRHKRNATSELLWRVAWVEGPALWVEPASGVGAVALRVELMSMPVALGERPDGVPIGSGPFEIRRVWPLLDTHPLDVPGLIPNSDYTDQVVLERRSLVPLGGLRRVVFLGMEDPPSDEATPARVRRALDEEAIHLLWSFSQDQRVAWKEASRPDRWFPSPMDGRGVLVASMNPLGFPPLSVICRSALLDALRAAASDTAFLQKNQLRPAGQILPVRFPLYHRQPPAMDLEPPPSGCAPVLLTNDGWRREAGALEQFLTKRGFQVTRNVVTPQEQLAKEKENGWHIQLLSYLDAGEPAGAFLLANFGGREWYEGFGEASRRLYGEADAAKDSDLSLLVERLSDSIVALGLVSSHHAVNARLLGFKPTGYAVNAAELDLRRPGEAWIPIGGLLFLLVSLAAMLYVDHRVRKAWEERSTSEVLMAIFHHELSAPLSTLHAWGEDLEATHPRASSAITREADAALDLVDRSWWFFSDGGLRKSMEKASVALERDVLLPVLESLRERATRAGLSGPSLVFDVQTPPELPRVRISVEAGLLVLRNVLENALKYRKPGRLEIGIRCEVEPDAVVLRVQDQGLGLDDSIREMDLFKVGYRTPEARSLAIGSGVGLGIVRTVLRAAGGDIQLTKRRDPTEFTLRLRRAPLDSET